MGLVSHDINILLPEYLFYYLLGFDLTTISNSAGIALINNGDISSVQIPLPEISIQKALVESLQIERKYINSTFALMRLFEQKIKDRIAKVWVE
jgi:type I restriction enzyme M protein